MLLDEIISWSLLRFQNKFHTNTYLDHFQNGVHWSNFADVCGRQQILGDSSSSLFVSLRDWEVGTEEALILVDKSLKQVLLCLYEDRKLSFGGNDGWGWGEWRLLGFLDSLIWKSGSKGACPSWVIASPHCWTSEGFNFHHSQAEKGRQKRGHPPLLREEVLVQFEAPSPTHRLLYVVTTPLSGHTSWVSGFSFPFCWTNAIMSLSLVFMHVGSCHAKFWFAKGGDTQGKSWGWQWFVNLIQLLCSFDMSKSY